MRPCEVCGADYAVITYTPTPGEQSVSLCFDCMEKELDE